MICHVDAALRRITKIHFNGVHLCDKAADSCVRLPLSSTVQEVVARGGRREKGSETKTLPSHSALSSAITFT